MYAIKLPLLDLHMHGYPICPTLLHMTPILPPLDMVHTVISTFYPPPMW